MTKKIKFRDKFIPDRFQPWARSMMRIAGVKKKQPMWKMTSALLTPDQQAEREEAMRKRLGGLTLGELPASMKTVATNPRYQPWKCTLWVQDHRFATDYRPVTYFTRGPDPNASLNLAHQLWVKWEKKGMGISPDAEFPDIRGIGDALCIDESDWARYLEEARKWGGEKGYAFHFAGDAGHPFFWTVPQMNFDVEGYQTITEDADYRKIIEAQRAT